MIYDTNGYPVKVDTFTVNHDLNVKAINHRGYSVDAPENTIPAYIMSKKMGFSYVECDVSFTSDGVAVLLHDNTIDRTSNGSGAISSLTYEEVSSYDFGSWKSEQYTGTKIPTFEEFIQCCKFLGLYPYIELKSNGGYTQEMISGIVSTVEKYGMKGKVTYISFLSTYLHYVKNADEYARLGYLSVIDQNAMNLANQLKTGYNEVFMDVSHTNVNDEGIQMCIDNGLPLELWTINDENTLISKVTDYVSGVTSDCLIAGKILYEKKINEITD